MSRCHSDMTLRCDHSECDYVTADKEYLKKHLLIHSDYRPFVCNIDDCGKKFKRNYILKRHKISHTSGLFQCTHERCEHTFKAEIYLKQHIANKHSSRPKSYVCRACRLSFDTLGKRGYHQQMVHHIPDEPIVCQINHCSKVFKSLHCYRKHVRRLHSSQQFRCDHSGCDYITNNKESIKRHVKTHSESELFVCGIDGYVKAFPLKIQLKKSHSSDRFACIAFGCNQIFKAKEHFDRHMKAVHSLLYKCKSDGCLETFRSSCQYKIHLRECHNKRLTSCDHSHCDYTTYKQKSFEESF